MIDTFNFEDELGHFVSQKDETLKTNQHLGIFGCASLETEIFSNQEADGILALGLSTGSIILLKKQYRTLLI